MFAHYFQDGLGKVRDNSVKLQARSGRATPIGRLVPITSALVRLYRTWKSRDRDRSELARMSDRELRDISMTRCDAICEVNKPFWKP